MKKDAGEIANERRSNYISLLRMMWGDPHFLLWWKQKRT